MDGGRDFSAKAREEWIRKEEQAHEAVRAMLRRLDETERDARPSTASANTSLIPGTNGARDEKPSFSEEEAGGPRRVVSRNGVGGVQRYRRMGKFVEHLPSEEEVEEMEREQVEVSASAEEKADWRLSRIGPKIVAYERAPWEEDEPESGPEEEEEVQVEKPPSPAPPVHAPVAPVYVQQNVSRIFLEDISEDEEDEEEDEEDEEIDGSTTSHSVPGSSPSSSKSKPKVYMPPADYVRPTQPSPPGGHFPVYKLPADIFPAPPTPRSPNFPPMSPISDAFIPTISKTIPPKSPTNLRTRAGLKKIFLSIRPRRRDDEPLSPTPTLSSSAATTPSLPTPTIRITSPFHPRRFDGSPIGDEHPTMGKLSPLSPVESVSYRLPELRLSRADWGEWGRQVAERL